MRIGPMRHRITIETNVGTDDGYGGQSDDWQTRATCWAGVEHKAAAGAATSSGQLFDRTVVYFIVREINASGARQGDRVQFDGSTYFVQSVTNRDERGKFLTLVALDRELA